jgi:hypothetical protein
LPPIIPHHLDKTSEAVDDKVLVYLPFEDLHDVQRFLENIRTHHFYLYCMDYPNVASILAQWIENGRWEDIEGLACDVWGLMKTNFSDDSVSQSNVPK